MRLERVVRAGLVCVLVAATGAHAQTFVDRLGSAGMGATEASQGVALGDYDGDGHTDVFLPSVFVDLPFPLPDLGSRDRLYRNSGTASFTDQAGAVGVRDDGQAQGAAWADYDNDGALDLYLVRGVQTALPQTHKLYHQVSGVFDASPSTYFTAAVAGRSVCWADYDNDGFVDAFLTNGLDSNILPPTPVRLFRNQGDGSFVEVTTTTGINDTRNGQACAWSDFDNDGDMDLYVANKGFEDPILGISDPQPNALYKNLLVETTVATFVDVAVMAGVTGIDAIDPGSASLGCTWADFNNDGWMDLYVTNGFTGIIPTPIDVPNRLFENNRDGTFRDASLRFIFGLSLLPSFSSTWADFDNDGDLDVYVTNANIPPLVQATNELFRNGGWPLYLFSDASASAGIDVAVFGGACAAADFNGDGYLDIYSSHGAPGAEILFTVPDSLWMNDGGSNHWLQFDLVGTVSNRSAIGARVTLTIGTRNQTREVAAGSGFQSMDDLRVEFGLGTSTVANTVTIRWPSGCVQVLENVDADQVVEVVEDCGDEMLRNELRTPIGTMFPLPGYDPLAAVQSWSDREAVLLLPQTFFYQHGSASVTIRMVKSTDTVTASW